MVRGIQAVEAVQHRATKVIPSLKNLSYEQCLRQLRLPTLGFRRLRGDMIETFKITHQIYDIEPSLFFSVAKTRSTRGHSMKLEKKRANTTCI